MGFRVHSHPLSHPAASESQAASPTSTTPTDVSSVTVPDHIASRQDYRFFLEADRLALGIEHGRPRPFRDEVWRFQRRLRQVEFWMNCRTAIWWKPCYWYLRWRFKQASCQCGFTIPPNVFGPGLSIAHRGTIVVNDDARVGANCRLHVCVNIGTSADRRLTGSPRIGNNVYIGPGAKIFGDVEIADDVVIGANSVVNKSFLAKGITVAGVPARKISDQGSLHLLVRATELLLAWQLMNG
jgi:serine O-acetyltransferase